MPGHLCHECIILWDSVLMKVQDWCSAGHGSLRELYRFVLHSVLIASHVQYCTIHRLPARFQHAEGRQAYRTSRSSELRLRLKPISTLCPWRPNGDIQRFPGKTHLMISRFMLEKWHGEPNRAKFVEFRLGNSEMEVSCCLAKVLQPTPVMFRFERIQADTIFHTILLYPSLQT